MREKINLPNEVLVGGDTWKIEKDPKYAGACFSIHLREIIIGTKPSNPLIYTNFLHEIIEAVFVKRKMENFYKKVC